MPFTPILAHGALGVADELVFLAIAIIFVVMMGVSWIRSRNLPPDEEDIEIIEKPEAEKPADDRPEHFNLR